MTDPALILGLFAFATDVVVDNLNVGHPGT